MKTTIYFKSGRSYTSVQDTVAENLKKAFDDYRLSGLERYFVWFKDGLIALHEIEQIEIIEHI